jgi:hypothetical protein
MWQPGISLVRQCGSVDGDAQSVEERGNSGLHLEPGRQGDAVGGKA